MSFDVFSQVRCLSPNRKDTAIKNYKHVFYIANRKHCFKNEYGNTLFGTIYDFDNIESVQNSKIANYIQKKSLDKTNIYRGIVSLSEEDAIEQGFIDNNSWKNMITESIEKIAKELEIPFSNLEWIATVHYKKGNPHLHYLLWDRQQKVKSPFIHISTQHKIRNILKHNVYRDYYNELFYNKNMARDNLRDEKIKQEFKAVDKSYCNNKIAYINFDKKLLKELREDLKNIKHILPKKGRLSYTLMPKYVKDKIDEFIDKLIKNNCDLKNSYESYLTSCQKIAEFYNSNKEDVFGYSEIVAHRILGNQLLKYFKEDLYLKYNIEQILQEIYYELSQNEEQEKIFLQRYVFNKDLSVYAKKEYAFKQKFSNYIGREM